MRIDRTYEASAAHQLNAGVPEGHKCRRLHGHRYIITVTLIGDVNPETGMLMEYGEIDRRVAEVLAFVDHRFLNMLGHEAAVGTTPPGGFPVIVSSPIAGMTLMETDLAEKVRKNPTTENLQAWFQVELSRRFDDLRTFKVGPTVYRPPQVYAVRIEENSRSGVE